MYVFNVILVVSVLRSAKCVQNDDYYSRYIEDDTETVPVSDVEARFNETGHHGNFAVFALDVVLRDVRYKQEKLGFDNLKLVQMFEYKALKLLNSIDNSSMLEYPRKIGQTDIRYGGEEFERHHANYDKYAIKDYYSKVALITVYELERICSDFEVVAEDVCSRFGTADSECRCGRASRAIIDITLFKFKVECETWVHISNADCIVDRVDYWRQSMINYKFYQQFECCSCPNRD